MNPKQNRDRGKRCEADIAVRLSGRRMGVMGAHDVEAGPFAVEVKSRVAFVGTGFMAQAARNCPTGKTPLVVVHLTGTRHEGDLVMMRMCDWQEWFGKLTVMREVQNGCQD
jgi:hypothetical protein